jgi:hypothetical protein
LKKGGNKFVLAILFSRARLSADAASPHLKLTAEQEQP